MIKDVSELISKSGDSQLIDYIFRDEILTIEMELDGIDAIVNFSVKTHIVSGHRVLDGHPSHKACFLDYIHIEDVLKTINDYYIAPPDFVSLMKQKREGLNLAYGEKKNKGNGIFQVRNHCFILACFVHTKDDIIINTIK